MVSSVAACWAIVSDVEGSDDALSLALGVAELSVADADADGTPEIDAGDSTVAEGEEHPVTTNKPIAASRPHFVIDVCAIKDISRFLYLTEPVEASTGQ